MKIATVQAPQNGFIYKPTRRRFLHAAMGLPAAASLIPFLSPSEAKATVDTGEVKPHSLKFITHDGNDPGVKVVFVFMQGGLSFFDTFDPKTNSMIRGPFDPIDTSAKGLQVTEILQPLARHMDKFVVFNNMFTRDGDHDRSAAIILTTSSKVRDNKFMAPAIHTNPFVEFSQMLTNEASPDVGYVVLHQSTKDIHGYNRIWEKPWGALKHNDPETLYSPFDTKTGSFTNPFATGLNSSLARFKERRALLEELEQHG